MHHRFGHARLSTLPCLQLQVEGSRTVFVAGLDPGNTPANPAWPFRNLLLLVATRWQLQSVTVVAFRSRGARLSTERSLAFEVDLPDISTGAANDLALRLWHRQQSVCTHHLHSCWNFHWADATINHVKSALYPGGRVRFSTPPVAFTWYCHPEAQSWQCNAKPECDFCIAVDTLLQVDT